VGCGGPAKGTADWHSDQGAELTKQGRYNEAIEEWNKANELNSNLAVAYYKRGYVYKQQGKKAEVIANFEKFITLTARPHWIEMARQQIQELSK